MWKVLVLACGDLESSEMVDECFSDLGGVVSDIDSPSLDTGSTVA